MDRNIRTFQGYFADTTVKARPVVTSHLCPQIGHRQLDAGGTVGGIAVTTMGEAEVFANSGFSDILLANQVVTVSKIRRLCALAGQTSIGIAVDSSDNARQLSSGAVAAGVELRVLVEIDAGMGRCGISPGIDAVAWAQKMVAYGAGEILLTSMDRDGTKEGFDLELTRAVSDAVSVPVIASGGVGNLEHLAEGIIQGHADAVLAASIFHFGEYTIEQAKQYMRDKGIEVRL